ncbi:hypothetical protein D3C84_1077180 [compost metagenome]
MLDLLFQQLVAILQTGDDGGGLLPAIYGQQIDAVPRIHQNDMEGVAVINGLLHHVAIRCRFAGGQVIASPFGFSSVMRHQRKLMANTAIKTLPAP